MVLSKMVIACSRQSHFHKAKIYLRDFHEILREINDRPIFKALASNLEIVLKRNQKDFKDIEKLLADALANAELIEPGFLTAAIHLIVATVSSFKDVCMYVCKTLFQYTNFDNYLQLVSTKGVYTQRAKC